MTVSASCTLTADPLAFGTVTLLTADIAATGNLTVDCTQGTVYTIALDNGLGAAATSATRLMTKPAGTPAGSPVGLAAYSIYKDVAHANVWGNAGTELYTSPAGATGVAEVIPFYALAIRQSVPAGAYTDTVTATITY
ncbi:MAG: spore coat U domain-containing protein [Rhizobium sp.]